MLKVYQAVIHVEIKLDANRYGIYKMKIFILFINILLIEILYCQDFPRKDISLLNGKDLIVKEKPNANQYTSFYGFYTDENLNSSYGDFGNYKLLAGKKFRMISYELCEKENLFQGERYYKLKIENDSIGILFYKYDSESKMGFPFEVVGGINLPIDFYCKEIKKTFNKFTNETIYRSPEVEGLTFIKIEKNKKAKIYLSIEIGSHNLTLRNKGLILLLENNKRIERANERIDVKPMSQEMFGILHISYIYSAFIELTRAEIKLLKEYDITDKRLYIHEGNIRKDETLRECLKCLIN